MKKEVIMLLILVLSLSFVTSAEYATGGKEITLKYILNGEEANLNLNVYKGVVDYLGGVSRNIVITSGEEVTLADFKNKSINEPIQRGYLLDLPYAIQSITDDKIDQIRIAISIVQNIRYEKSNKTSSLNSKQEIEYSRWPYEVLYDEKGICGEKSELLVFILKELGYNVGMFRYVNEDHEVVALKCPKKYGVEETGYCFVETTGPSIITDNSIEYVGGIKLESSPLLIELYSGEELGKGLREYNDARIMKRASQGKFLLFKKWRLNRLNKKYGLVNEYNIE